MILFLVESPSLLCYTCISLRNPKNLMKKHLLLLSVLFLISCGKEEPIPEPTKYNVSITLNPTDGGTVSPNGGQFTEGQSVSFSVTPSENYIFKSWSGSNSSSDNPLKLIIDSNKNLTVNFEKKDTDGDGKPDDVDNCPNTPQGETVDEFGCSDSQKDTDGDGVMDNTDTCPNTPQGETVDENGCSESQKDTDGDGVTDDLDLCPDTLDGQSVNEHGCTLSDKYIYTDLNGVTLKSVNYTSGETVNYKGNLYIIVDLDLLISLKNNGNSLTYFITTLVTDMTRLFYGSPSSSVFTGIETWDVSNVTNMSEMFSGTRNSQNIFNHDISNWDVSNVENMERMFYNSYFDKPVNGWDVSKVTNMKEMFSGFNYDNISYFNKDISNWNVSNVTTMSGMFNNGTFNQDISNWNVSNVTDMSSMFNSSSFNQSLENWDVSNVTNMDKMFSYSIFNRPIGNWNVSNVTTMRGMFTISEFNQDISNWDVGNVTDMTQMFYYSKFNQNISNWNVSTVTSMKEMFRYNIVFNFDLSNWNVSNVIDCKRFNLDSNISIPPLFLNCSM